MRAFLHVSTLTLTAVVHMASIAVALGAMAAVYSQSIKTGVLVTAGALVAGIVGFGYSLWKIHKPNLKVPLAAPR
jgi:hypothetical protein